MFQHYTNNDTILLQACCFAPTLCTVTGAEQRNDNSRWNQDDVAVGPMVRQDFQRQTKITSSNSIRYYVVL